MCGIAGSVHFSLDIPRLTRDLYHRGPDEQTTFSEDAVILHHHRLAILDIAGGKQPMTYKHLTIIFNGEIYNHQDLRKKYSLQCSTNSDTETLLHLYDKLGPAFLNDMDGMFALAIYDRDQKKLFIARDRAGKKPLYYFNNGNQFIFCSELRALAAQLPLEMDTANVLEFARMGFMAKDHTPYQHVKELPPASYAYVSLEKPGITIHSWWNAMEQYQKRNNDDFATAMDRVDSMLHTAIKRRVESSDLEVGSFLSGGIDSGLVTAIAKNYNNTLKTFTVSFEGEYDEAPLAKLVADKYQTDHHEIKISFNHLVDDVEKILANYGEPHYDDSAIPSYYVSREARKSLTVILNGDGGDEVFAGYRRYLPFSKIDFFKPSAFRRGLFNTMYNLTPASQSKMNKLNYLRRMFFLGSGKGLDTYLRSTTDIFEGYTEKVFQHPYFPSEPVREQMEKIFTADLSGLQKIMLLDFENILPAVLLVKMDIATMAHSLEGRSPFLCKELLEYVPGLNDNCKIRGTQTKYLLRQLATKYLPAELINQPKRGFEVPLKQWVNNELRQMIGDYLTSSSALYPSFMKKEFVQQLLDDKIKVNAEKRAKMLWLVFTLEVWYKKVFKK
ncbi:MAG TPA: asparagine synthase (glutamine-hydrolyzing) [Chitinophagaceae bacterium]|jgi:asparagine synthase (glutamine-hydrolysing)|nr:asparagine synthase (glutamine-hydrolyzing) [Chitinophagaceae bacterium]